MIALPTSRKMLCGIYALIAVIGLFATWRNAGPYTHTLTGMFLDIWPDAKANNATRFLAVDLLVIGLAVGIWMVVDARKHDVRFVWGFIAGSFLVAGCVFFPLYLLAREVRIADPEPLRLRTLDTVLLALVAAAMLGLAVWIDM